MKWSFKYLWRTFKKNPSYLSQSTMLLMRHFGPPSSQEPAGWFFYITMLWSWVLMFTSSERKYILIWHLPAIFFFPFFLLVLKYKNCPYKSGLGYLFCLHQPGGPMLAGAVTDVYSMKEHQKSASELRMSDGTFHCYLSPEDRNQTQSSPTSSSPS